MAVRISRTNASRKSPVSRPTVGDTERPGGGDQRSAFFAGRKDHAVQATAETIDRLGIGLHFDGLCRLRFPKACGGAAGQTGNAGISFLKHSM